MKVLHGGIFRWEESFQGVNLSGKILYWGNSPEFLYKYNLYVLLSRFRLNVTRGDVKCNCPG